jgi:hypothetical protein
MRKLLPILLVCGGLSTASAAPPFINNVIIPEPATNVLLICGLLTVGGLAIFLGKKLG